MPKRIDYSGRQVGRITVIEQVGVNKEGRQLWKCRCKCGNEYVTTSATLRSAQSCKRCSQAKDLTGLHFGKLKVFEHQYDAQNRHEWHCRCECGGTASYTTASLLGGKAKTCGHCPVTAFRCDNGVGVGRTASGTEFLFDMEDWHLVTSMNWHRTQKGYIVHIDDRRIALHRLVLAAPDEFQVDHINRDKTDCRKSNLRLATNADNAANQGTYRNNRSTGHKNIYLKDSLFRVEIRKDGVLNHFGYYDNLGDAIRIANEKRRVLFGEFAYFDDTNQAEVGSERIWLLAIA